MNEAKFGAMFMFIHVINVHNIKIQKIYVIYSFFFPFVCFSVFALFHCVFGVLFYLSNFKGLQSHDPLFFIIQKYNPGTENLNQNYAIKILECLKNT